ncbi:hypothetical protein DNI29_18475 [Hymenobacter sediminis]|uniref:hypothetical protein n=1 Tax=Hymenobacter sediminis TaxID=2218621 RepID=UPI000DA67BF5|nr:hypothetical protein [Hymenobacter sediminis]RPD45370.1 hypothetical protein DNI29_18475 [Hymenobacter sediminis]
MQKIIPLLFGLLCAAFVLLPRVFSVEENSSVSSPHYLPNLGIDTLKLKANYSECGEWGGHREMIKIYMSNKAKGTERDFMKWSGPFAAEFWLDTIGCSYRPDRRYFLVEQTELSIEQEALIMHYMQVLIHPSLKYHSPMHGGNLYSVSSSDPGKLDIRYFTSENEYNRFEILRQQLFNSDK